MPTVSSQGVGEVGKLWLLLPFTNLDCMLPAGDAWADVSIIVPMRLNGIVETCLYVDDMDVSLRFYEDLLGCKAASSGERLSLFHLGDSSHLLLFLRGATLEPIATNGGMIPPHDGSGPAHIGIGIDVSGFEAWESRLAELGVRLESKVEWPSGGRSLYFRDPDGHLSELLTPGVWATY